MAGQISGVHAKMDELWERKIEVDQLLCALHLQIQEENISEPLAVEVIRQESDVSFVFTLTLSTCRYVRSLGNRFKMCRYREWKLMSRLNTTVNL